MATYNELINTLIEKYGETEPENQELKLREAGNGMGLVDKFQLGEIPSQADYYGLLYNMLSRTDDGLFKSADQPLSILATNTPAQPVIHFYDEANLEPSWQIGLSVLAQSDRKGLNISDQEGNSQLFIDSESGNVGLGTAAPDEKLVVNGVLKVEDLIIEGEEFYPSALLMAKDFDELEERIAYEFGIKISLYENTLAVGMRLYNGGVGIYQYDEAATKWLAVQRISTEDLPNIEEEPANFGNSVYLYSNFLAIGGGNSVYIFYRNSTAEQWIYRQTLSTENFSDHPDATGANFGGDICINDHLLIIGNNRSGFGTAERKLIFTYRLDNDANMWTPVEPLRFSDTPLPYNYFFGISLSLDENLLAVGTKLDTAEQNGLVIFFRYNTASQTWTSLDPIEHTFSEGDPEFASDDFGASICLKGNLIAIGAPSDESEMLDEAESTINVNNAGSVYLYQLEEGEESSWQFLDKLQAKDFSPYITEFQGRNFGKSVGLFGNQLAIGAYGYVNPFSLGTIYLYQKSTSEQWIPQTKLQASDFPLDPNYQDAQLGETLTLSENRLILGSVAHYGFAGGVFVYDKTISVAQAVGNISSKIQQT